MKALSKIALLGASLALTVTANAAVGYNAGQPYIGAKIGQVDTDVVSEKALAYGVYGGYNFDQNFGAEVEFQGSETKEFGTGLSKAEYDAKTYGAYGTYRYHFNNSPLYVKGKLGAAKTEVDVKSKITSYTATYDKTGVAGGAGVGFQQGNFGVEAMYNHLGEGNVVSVGAHLAF